MTRNERNQAARKLLAYFYAGYERVGSRSFYISPQEHGVLEELGWDRQQYMVAMQRLIDKRLLKPMTLGGGCAITEDGVEASEDEALLDQLLPVDPAPAPKPLPASPPPAVASIAGSFEYEVALSFAGEDRAHAEALAEFLRNEGVTVFYDRYEQADLWGKDLFEHLHDVYSKKARYCVLFASAAYARKVWTDHERRSAQDRALQEKGNAYILPIRLDETEIPGIRSSTGHLSISMGIPTIGALLLQKLGRSAAAPSVGRSPLNEAVRRKVLEAFRHFKVSANQVLPQNSILYWLHPKLTPPEERVLDEVAEDMVRDGLIAHSDSALGGWVLTEEGEKLVYP
ncbi:MAG: TIR domain-containing protein [Myxococcales bacterium]|nr:TIR domain-containing protein [Myxococcales bacterium]